MTFHAPWWPLSFREVEEGGGKNIGSRLRKGAFSPLLCTILRAVNFWKISSSFSFDVQPLPKTRGRDQQTFIWNDFHLLPPGMDRKAGLRGNFPVPVCRTYLFVRDVNLQDCILSSDILGHGDVCLKIGHCQRTGKGNMWSERGEEQEAPKSIPLSLTWRPPSLPQWPWSNYK